MSPSAQPHPNPQAATDVSSSAEVSPRQVLDGPRIGYPSLSRRPPSMVFARSRPKNSAIKTGAPLASSKEGSA